MITFLLSIIMLFNLIGYPSLLYANEINLYFKGKITEITTFSNNSLPNSMHVGQVIYGELFFESTDYYKYGSILGNSESGCRYYFNDSLNFNLYSGELRWNITGSTISLIESTYVQSQYIFDVFSTSEKNNYTSFPKYAGRFEYGVALYDKYPPFYLFQSCNMDNLNLNLSEIDTMSGFITTRNFDNNTGDILSGYYIEFNIDKVSFDPIHIDSVKIFPPSIIKLILK